jgi:uncharacterized membrane protein
MNKFVVVIFPDETKAYEGTRALKALHGEGSLTVYGMSVIAKDASERVSIKQAVDAGPLGLGVGALVGGLIGALGGPIGAAIGIGYGALVGGVSDLFSAGVGADFVKTIADKLTPGKAALIAEVSEEWVTPLDTRMDALGGHVIREWRSDFEDLQIEKDVKAREAELAQLRTELKNASEERKAKLKLRVDQAKAKLEAAANRAKGRMDQLKQETEAKVKELQDQAAKARGDAKAYLDKEIAKMRADYDWRSGKLKQAWELTKEALT